MDDPGPEELYDEYLKIRQLRFLVDHTAQLLMTKKIAPHKVQEILAETREKVLELFPDKEATYNLIYGSRFKRLIEDFQNLDE